MIALIIVVTIALLLIVLMLSVFVYRFHSHGQKTENFTLDHNFQNRISNSTVNESQGFKIVEFRNFLSPDECRLIIEIAKSSGNMKAAETLDSNNNTLSSYSPEKRTSKTVFLPDSTSLLIDEISRITAHLTDLPVENQEHIQVASYEVGGKFDEHYDACDSTPDVCERFNRGSGQRVATLLIYLNDDFDGGRTVFSKLQPNVAIEPEIGKAILFYDTINENLIKESMHKGEPVLSGQKWICTKWVHSKKWNHS